MKISFLEVFLLKRNLIIKFSQDENKLFIGALVVLCCSCAGNSVLLDTESDLRGLNNEYELGKSKAIVGAELKAETFGDEDSIQMLKDNYIAEIMGRLEVAKEK